MNSSGLKATRTRTELHLGQSGFGLACIVPPIYAATMNSTPPMAKIAPENIAQG